MRRSKFLAYKKRFVDAARAVLAQERSVALYEAAFPAYANPNPFISFLFWHRVWSVMKHLGDEDRYDAVMDFGCGGGVMLAFLAKVARRVVAMDVDLSPLMRIEVYLPRPKNVDVCDATQKTLRDFEPASFDIILALDVLEHVDDLNTTIADLCRLLVPGGQVLVSGPTENLAYRIGRKLAGKDYSGEYHVRGVYSIRDVLAEFTQVSTLATLFYPVPLFKIYSGTVAPASIHRQHRES